MVSIISLVQSHMAAHPREQRDLRISYQGIFFLWFFFDGLKARETIMSMHAVGVSRWAVLLPCNLGLL